MTDRSMPHDVRPRSANRLGLAAAAIALVLLAWVVHFPQRRTFFVWDDIAHIQGVQEVGRGERSLADFLWAPHNEHVIPLWKLGFYAQWSAVGDSDWAWRLTLIGLHGLVGIALWGLLAAAGCDRRVAWLFAAAWSVQGVGIDSPATWVAASHLSLALFFLLLAAGEAIRYRDDSPAYSLILVAGLLTAAVLSMGSITALLLPLFLLGLLEPNWLTRVRGRPWGWTAALVLPLLVGLAAQYHAGMLLQAIHPEHAGLFSLRRTVTLTFEILGISIGELFLPTDNHDAALVVGAMVTAGIVLLLTMPRFRSLGGGAFTVVGAALFYTGASCWARSWIDDVALVLSFSRYRYVPALAGLVVVALVANRGMEALLRRKWLEVGLVAWLVVLMVGNIRMVATQRAQFVAAEKEMTESRLAVEEIFANVERYSQVHGQTVVLPASLTRSLGLRLDELAVLLRPQGTPGLRIVGDGEFSMRDMPLAVAALREVKTPTARRLVEELRGRFPNQVVPALPPDSKRTSVRQP